MEEAGTPNHFIVLRQEVLYDNNLTMSEKFVYARMCQFDEYFESCKEAGEILGISAETVKKAKQKLVKLGYAMELADTGRGKVYKVYDIEEQKRINRRVNSTRQTGKNMQVCRVKSTRRVKEIEKNNINCLDKSKQLAEADEHGNPDINDMFAAWYAVFGFEQKQSAENRRACYNLLRRKDLGKEKLTKMLYILEESQSDKFAPKEVKSIVGFATMQTYLPNLVMWARRRYVQKQPLQGIEI